MSEKRGQKVYLPQTEKYLLELASERAFGSKNVLQNIAKNAVAVRSSAKHRDIFHRCTDYCLPYGTTRAPFSRVNA